MKLLLCLCLFISFTALSQKVKINEYDKFIKQRRIELEPITILSSDKTKVSLSFNSIASTFYILLSGFGWGAFTVDANQEVIFLFSNDSTLSVKSTGLQTCDFGSVYNTYKHRYFITLQDVEALSQYELTGIRKYNFKDYSDMKVSKKSAVKIKKMSSVFLEELKKAKLLYTLKNIDVNNVAKHVGDSVKFCSKVFSTRYFEFSENKPTLLDVNSSYPNQLVNTVIWEQDRKNFGGPPEILYNNKEVCICGVVQLFNNMPQIVIHSREQITVKTPVSLQEVAMFTGDSITVSGKVFSGKYFSGSATAPTLLNMGLPYPDQLLTVVIENKDRKNFMEAPENYYVDKIVNVSGKVTLYNGKPQIIIRNKDQIVEVNTTNATAQIENKTSTAEYAAKISKSETTITDSRAEFPGGLEGFATFLQNNLKSPAELEPGEKVTVVVRFTIGADGIAQKFKIAKSAGNAFDREVLRVLKGMPKWKPKMHNGRAVEEVFTQPVTFNFVDTLSEVKPLKSF